LTWVALAGAGGAARLLRGLVLVVPPEDVTAVVNTGDDREFYGVHVSPDLDIVTYTLADRVDPERGYGLAGDDFALVEALAGFGHETWFRLGDRDFATHIARTNQLRRGRSLTEAAIALQRALGIPSTILPMADEPVRTEDETIWIPVEVPGRERHLRCATRFVISPAEIIESWSHDGNDCVATPPA
jgi:LPPG:FO 2-phospho-L-lactate transferase